MEKSTWNLENRFTGWTVIDLTLNGVSQAVSAGKILKAEGWNFDLCYTSVLKRAIHTLWHMLDEIDRTWLPVIKDYRLNERHYGALQGLIWRRSYDTTSSALEPSDPRGQRADRRYAHLHPEQIPPTESLKNTAARVVPYWNETISPSIRSGQRVLISAHGDSVRAFIKYLDDISDSDVVDVNIPNGISLVYEFDTEMRPLRRYYLGQATPRGRRRSWQRQGQSQPACFTEPKHTSRCRFRHGQERLCGISQQG